MGMNPRLLRPTPTGFDPRRIAGLALWLDAADSSTLTMNGSTVSEWRDKSGANRHATQTDAARQPGLASGGLSFGTTNIALLGTTAGWLASQFTVLVAADVNIGSSSVFARLFSQRFFGSSPDWNTSPSFVPLVRFQSSNFGAATFTNGTLQATAASNPRPCVYAVTKAAGASGQLRIFLNGSVSASGTASSDTGAVPALQYSIGAEITASGTAAASTGFVGTVWSVVAFSRLLSDAELARVTRFLGRRFNITVA
jgi:hypothetical protein